MAELTQIVRYRNVFGRLGTITMVDRSEFVTPGSSLEQRLVVVQGDQVYVRKYVSSAAGKRNPRLYDLLDNEIRAGSRLRQVFAGPYPPELAELVAYNMDAEEPFALLRAYTGEPAADLVHRFDDGQRRLFHIGLLRALQHLGEAGVVHAAVTANAVRWDGRQLQLVDFESAAWAGEPRRSGSGEVDTRDDLLAAGLLIRTVYTGAPADGARPDRSRDPELLRALYDPIFDKPVEHWPHPANLLQKLRENPVVRPKHDPEAALAAGRQLFDQISAAKRGPHPVDAVPTETPRTDQRARRILPFLAATVLVAVLIIGMAVLA
ncbi:MAG TPA: hypothetical protein VGX25_17335 [Actinophytocola sp.]|uniref:hypothetical protein n=1 Tax=Actinophytocola sp. TaxID=1872138 RepID=UPI002DDDB5F8|nr:hypothetical protein [Actinophytocola sp.]HEV2781151.1 hypothetical protein [Actinophytocola sp.]